MSSANMIADVVTATGVACKWVDAQTMAYYLRDAASAQPQYTHGFQQLGEWPSVFEDYEGRVVVIRNANGKKGYGKKRSRIPWMSPRGWRAVKSVKEKDIFVQYRRRRDGLFRYRKYRIHKDESVVLLHVLRTDGKGNPITDPDTVAPLMAPTAPAAQPTAPTHPAQPTHPTHPAQPMAPQYAQPTGSLFEMFGAPGVTLGPSAPMFAEPASVSAFPMATAHTGMAPSASSLSSGNLSSFVSAILSQAGSMEGSSHAAGSMAGMVQMLSAAGPVGACPVSAHEQQTVYAPLAGDTGKGGCGGSDLYGVSTGCASMLIDELTPSPYGDAYGDPFGAAPYSPPRPHAGFGAASGFRAALGGSMGGMLPPSPVDNVFGQDVHGMDLESPLHPSQLHAHAHTQGSFHPFFS